MNIKKIREDLDYTQEQFANFVGVSRQTIVRWERGEEIPPAKREFLNELLQRLNALPVVSEPGAEYNVEKEREITNLTRKYANLADEVISLRKHIAYLERLLRDNKIEYRELE
jgi:transcriptional regulator with XRE-family HTH domain